MLQLLLQLVKKYPDFHFALSVSGVFLEQAEKWGPAVIELLQELVKHKEQVELVAENYYHSLACFYSPTEFRRQVRAYLQLVWKLFKVRPQTFRNTEMIYSNAIGQQVRQLGFDLLLTEAVDRYLQGRDRTQLWRAAGSGPDLYLLLKHAQLSDDIAFRFSQKSWPSWPLTAEKYIDWLNQYGPGDFINLFMDFETFGEHQWEETGIFEFFAQLVKQYRPPARGKRSVEPVFVTPTEAKNIALKGLVGMDLDTDVLPVYDVPVPISWADQERDISAWIDNDLQKDALSQLYALEKKVYGSGQKELITDWQRLTTSDHFYYMCTKYFTDGDVHAYFNAYNSPLEAYRRFCIVLADLHCRLDKGATDKERVGTKTGAAMKVGQTIERPPRKAAAA
jgi:alpha-amylase